MSPSQSNSFKIKSIYAILFHKHCNGLTSHVKQDLMYFFDLQGPSWCGFSLTWSYYLPPHSLCSSHRSLCWSWKGQLFHLTCTFSQVFLRKCFCTFSQASSHRWVAYPLSSLWSLLKYPLMRMAFFSHLFETISYFRVTFCLPNPASFYITAFNTPIIWCVIYLFAYCLSLLTRTQIPWKQELSLGCLHWNTSA